MENMAYCRFENTLASLRECKGALEDGGRFPLKELSDSERLAAIRLLELCKDITERWL